MPLDKKMLPQFNTSSDLVTYFAKKHSNTPEYVRGLHSFLKGIDGTQRDVDTLPADAFTEWEKHGGKNSGPPSPHYVAGVINFLELVAESRFQIENQVLQALIASTSKTPLTAEQLQEQGKNITSSDLVTQFEGKYRKTPSYITGLRNFLKGSDGTQRDVGTLPADAFTEWEKHGGKDGVPPPPHHIIGVINFLELVAESRFQVDNRVLQALITSKSKMTLTAEQLQEKGKNESLTNSDLVTHFKEKYRKAPNYAAGLQNFLKGSDVDTLPADAFTIWEKTGVKKGGPPVIIQNTKKSKALKELFQEVGADFKHPLAIRLKPSDSLASSDDVIEIQSCPWSHEKGIVLDGSEWSTHQMDSREYELLTKRLRPSPEQVAGVINFLELAAESCFQVDNLVLQALITSKSKMTLTAEQLQEKGKDKSLTSSDLVTHFEGKYAKNSKYLYGLHSFLKGIDGTQRDVDTLPADAFTEWEKHGGKDGSPASPDEVVGVIKFLELASESCFQVDNLVLQDLIASKTKMTLTAEQLQEKGKNESLTNSDLVTHFKEKYRKAPEYFRGLHSFLKGRDGTQRDVDTLPADAFTEWEKHGGKDNGPPPPQSIKGVKSFLGLVAASRFQVDNRVLQDLIKSSRLHAGKRDSHISGTDGSAILRALDPIDDKLVREKADKIVQDVVKMTTDDAVKHADDAVKHAIAVNHFVGVLTTTPPRDIKFHIEKRLERLNDDQRAIFEPAYYEGTLNAVANATAIVQKIAALTDDAAYPKFIKALHDTPLLERPPLVLAITNIYKGAAPDDTIKVDEEHFEAAVKALKGSGARARGEQPDEGDLYAADDNGSQEMAAEFQGWRPGLGSSAPSSSLEASYATASYATTGGSRKHAREDDDVGKAPKRPESFAAMERGLGDISFNAGAREMAVRAGEERLEIEKKLGVIAKKDEFSELDVFSAQTGVLSFFTDPKNISQSKKTVEDLIKENKRPLLVELYKILEPPNLKQTYLEEYQHLKIIKQNTNAFLTKWHPAEIYATDSAEISFRLLNPESWVPMHSVTVQQDKWGGEKSDASISEDAIPLRAFVQSNFKIENTKSLIIEHPLNNPQKLTIASIGDKGVVQDVTQWYVDEGEDLALDPVSSALLPLIPLPMQVAPSLFFLGEKDSGNIHIKQLHLDTTKCSAESTKEILDAIKERRPINVEIRFVASPDGDTNTMEVRPRSDHPDVLEMLAAHEEVDVRMEGMTPPLGQSSPARPQAGDGSSRTMMGRQSDPTTSSQKPYPDPKEAVRTSNTTGLAEAGRPSTPSRGFDYTTVMPSPKAPDYGIGRGK